MDNYRYHDADLRGGVAGRAVQVYEAAAIDGANTWQIFRKITLPMLRPTTFFVVTLGLIGTFQVFDQVYVMSSGGPAKTTLTIAYMVYREGFRNSAMGIGATVAIVLFFIIFAVTMVQRRITRAGEAGVPAMTAATSAEPDRRRPTWPHPATRSRRRSYVILFVLVAVLPDPFSTRSRPASSRCRRSPPTRRNYGRKPGH